MLANILTTITLIALGFVFAYSLAGKIVHQGQAAFQLHHEYLPIAGFVGFLGIIAAANALGKIKGTR